MKVAVSEFKAKCTKFFRTIEEHNETIEITRRGKIIAIVRPPGKDKIEPTEFLDCLQGSIAFAPNWDDPLGEEDWDACS
ncbi:MAG: hypothetical protein J7L69_04120 [Desulfobulbaceae bacterium]|nr:hypothetical protein [Desulfobulbaceae bacterium]